MRYFNLAVLIAVVAVVAMAGFRGHHFRQPPFEIFPDMNYQPKVKDQQPSDFFADGMASRPPVDGTVAEEMPAVIDYWASGKYDDSQWGDGIPVHASHDGERPLVVSDADMARGRERYSINCAVCHGAAGDGKGITSQYGINATSYQSDRIRAMSDGEIFNTISNGKGQMLGYGYNIAIDDRWRIIMYIRALQHSENAALQDASPEEQENLNKTKKPAATTLNQVSPNSVDSFAVPARFISDWPQIVGKTYYYKFSDPTQKAATMDESPKGHFHFDVGYQFDSPSGSASKEPIKLDYGMHYSPWNATYHIKYLDQKTVVGWYEGGLSHQF
jgi:mono/diheme cytochrome c family protein